MGINEKETQEYWEKILIKHGLGMDKGLCRQECFVGTSNNIVEIEEKSHNEGQPEDNCSRRVGPKGHSPDSYIMDEF
jgi:hypothetical protein